VDVAKLEL
jgi:hypothetical protein